MNDPGNHPNAQKGAGNPFSGAPGARESDHLEILLVQNARRQHKLVMFALTLLLLIDAAACGFVYWMFTTTQGRLRNTQYNSDAWSRKTISEVTNHATQARQAAAKAELMAEQSRKDREWFVGLKVEAVNNLTNASLELSRQLLRQLNEYAQTNLLRLEELHAVRLKELHDTSARQRVLTEKSLEEGAKNAARSLAKYDPLLKIDPDVAERIDIALKQMKQIVEVLELIKAREEADVKSLQTDLSLVRESVKVIEVRQALLHQMVTNLPPPNLGVASPPQRSAPVKAPTAPTASPTASPTAKPTAAPPFTPTASPAAAPAVKPTSTPPSLYPELVSPSRSAPTSSVPPKTPIVLPVPRQSSP